MANAYTDTTALSNAVKAAYDKLFEFNLRSQPLFRALADKRPAQQTNPGSSVTFELYNDLDEQTATLTETTDPDAIAVGNTNTVTLTLNEYGAAVLRTRRLRLFALSDVDPAIANMIAYNAATSVDTVVQTELRGGSRLIQKMAGDVTYVTNASASTAATTMAATDAFDSSIARLATAKLRTSLAVPKRGNLYGAYIHPEVSHDLRAESGAGGWRLPHEYSAVGNIWAGEIGTYEGAFFVESPRCYNAVDAGTGDNTVRRFRTYYCGQQALAEAVAEEFHIVAGPIVDKLARFRPLGWYGVAGWKRYREEALLRVETTSSIDSE
ncbi:N4-gp56 family major capsid protein [Streptomyces hoynatensis]|uniref:N4-gp56 family major capsid protein n=1 Tax=Streptomyces hoynatensis TaxID=1141874 RepID=A0A3A9YFJ5_9ACTN|nr:N4-gp56 family major capsid protein [Streptomyces hoynatensis]RKN35945.1 N4-gp56 family major capsid protein [Streptomyces hoynatensis]